MLFLVHWDIFFVMTIISLLKSTETRLSERPNQKAFVAGGGRDFVLPCVHIFVSRVLLEQIL